MIHRTVLPLLLLGLLGATPAMALVNARGSDDTIDIATWNLRQFPQEGGTTTSLVGIMIDDLELDVIGVQEITDEQAFQTAAANAGGWGAVTGPVEGGNLRLGVWYDNSKVEITGATYTISGQAFTRNPFVVPMAVTENDVTLEFNFVVLHLKAYPEYWETRMAEMAALKEYIDSEIDAGNDRWVVLGDYNDELEDPDDENIFLSFTDDEDYDVLTGTISQIGFYATYIFGGYFIDHIMVTDPLLTDYGDEGEVETLRLDDEYSGYTDYISDHRPVAAYFPALSSSVAEDRYAARPNDAALNVWPVPSNATVEMSWALPSGQGTLHAYDLLGREVLVRPVSGATGMFSWQAANVPSGVYLLRLEGGSGVTVTRKAVIVR